MEARKTLTMHISLTPELESVVKRKVESGLYNNASEVIREALRQSLQREFESEWIQREAALGYAQLLSGNKVKVRSKKEFFSLARA
jgi:antitoxin ParD1/3/4